MSGGHFDYQQSRLHDMAEAIEELIDAHGKPGNWGTVYDLSPETIARFREAIALLRSAYVYVQRIDWLVSCDDDEETFHERLEKELAKLENEVKA